ncbi:LacI family DNA-binding transcriptional regulator [Paenibacillus eucommiae]|uniref:LacI family transcriptional regulator n=1 Tax=Paenibacillus eucommiae TaxID=1355755 RepID=A0ABS4IZI8_9BACL|nr:LacI family DNA-binding transcriptional regulator [Paenibacillus eucommiae]MBP1992968.1 LacI family transcriptional regulator [Paenibacillus eucommiae]
MVTRKEVAKLAGVSEATVSRVFNGVGPMKEGTKSKVLAAAKELNYHPNAIAQNFARRRSGNLGVVLPYTPKVHLFSTYYFSETLSGIGEEARKQEYDILLMLLSPDEPVDYARLYRSQKVDACVILGSMDTPEHRQSLMQLRDLKLPFCLVNQHFAGMDFNEIDADHVEGSYTAVRHLQERGFQNIAFLNGSSFYSNSLDRLEGYEKAIREQSVDGGMNGINKMNSREQVRIEGNYSRTSGYQAAAELWERRLSVDAIFAANDRMAIGLMQGLRERGWHAGRDYAIVGCDDSDAARLSSPSLSSIYVPFFDMGKRAAKVALEQFAAGDSGQVIQEKLPTKLVVRETSGEVSEV